MMSVVIIEDEPSSSDLLLNVINSPETDMKVTAVIPTVAKAIEFFRTRPAIDLIFSDVQLKDELSFQIFETIQPDCPIIFVSAFDQYVVNAFEYSGIDFLIKPVSQKALMAAVSKYRSLEKHFARKNTDLAHILTNYLTRRKTRLIAKKGTTFVSLQLNNIVCFYTENMVVYARDNGGNKYIVDKNLNALEEELDIQQFFRANRQFIVNVNYVLGYKTYERVKLIVKLEASFNHIVIVGQEKARSFRQWLSQA